MALWDSLPRWVWVGPTPNQGPSMVQQRGMVLHIAQGSYSGTIGWQLNPDSDVSSHFIVDTDGDIAQMVDTSVAAWTQAAGNGRWISVEFAGFSGNPLTPQQLEAAAQIYAQGVRQYGWPLMSTDSPSGVGLGWHGMGGTAWGNHPMCPGEPIKAQRPAILARATQILNGIQGSDMGAVIITTDHLGNYVLMSPQTHVFWRIPKRPDTLPPGATYWVLENNLEALRRTGVSIVEGSSFGWGGGYNVDDPATRIWLGQEVVAEGAVTLSPEDLAELVAEVRAAAKEGAEAGSLTEAEVVEAARQGAELAEDS